MKGDGSNDLRRRHRVGDIHPFDAKAYTIIPRVGVLIDSEPTFAAIDSLQNLRIGQHLLTIVKQVFGKVHEFVTGGDHWGFAEPGPSIDIQRVEWIYGIFAVLVEQVGQGRIGEPVRVQVEPHFAESGSKGSISVSVHF